MTDNRVNAIPLDIYSFRVEKVEQLSHDVRGIWLLADDSTPPFAYAAGQYVDIVFPDGQRRSYSIASAPLSSELLEIHVRRIAEGGFAEQLTAAYKIGDLLTLTGPFGRTGFLDRDKRPSLLLAGSTGIAPVKSMIEQALAQKNVDRDLYLYWGVRSRVDLYLQEKILEWCTYLPSLRYIPVLSNSLPGDEWSGASGWVHETVLRNHSDLGQFKAYVSGPLAMVHAVRDNLIQAGLPRSQLFSDLL